MVDLFRIGMKLVGGPPRWTCSFAFNLWNAIDRAAVARACEPRR